LLRSIEVAPVLDIKMAGVAAAAHALKEAAIGVAQLHPKLLDRREIIENVVTGVGRRETALGPARAPSPIDPVQFRVCLLPRLQGADVGRLGAAGRVLARDVLFLARLRKRPAAGGGPGSGH